MIQVEQLAGRYTLEKLIGQGAMGLVYRGSDVQTGRPVAVKALKPALTAQHPALVERFRREGEALRRLDHPNIVKLLDVVTVPATAVSPAAHYLVLEYVAGGDLQHLLPQAPLPLDRLLNIALDLADALTRAHRLNIIHRDLKPANVLLDEQGTPRLTDFGIAHLADQSALTDSGVVLGTAAYLSPEACLGRPLDPRSDIWSFGVLLYELLTGRRPFDGPNLAALLHQILHQPLPDIHPLRPDIPPALEDLLFRMLARNQADRLPSVRLAGAALEALLLDRPPVMLRPPAPEKAPFAGEMSRRDPTERTHRPRHNLPAATTPFVGRETELATLEQLLADPAVRLVTLLGSGGAGKTRLALELAGRLVAATGPAPSPFPDGIYFVELAALETEAQLLMAVAAAVGFVAEKASDPGPELLAFLHRRQMLLLLDNFEQLMARAATVDALLAAAPWLQVLATSRQKLNLNGESILNVGGLALPQEPLPADAGRYAAVRLFEQSARRVQIDFQLTAEALPSVATICRLAAGIPLAIILAAAWSDMLSPAEIAAEMAADIDFLAGDMGNLPPRQQSMRAVFDYSWRLLAAPEQQVLARLAVFQDGFTRQAAQAITGATLRQLTALVNKSLLRRDAATGRFDMHPLLRQYAREKLAATGRLESARDAHLAYYAGLLGRQESRLAGERPPAPPAPRPTSPEAILLDPLSPRELEVLALIAQGLSNRDIAGRLVVTLNTVKSHNHHIFSKLDVKNRTQAVIKGRALGLIP